MIKLITIVIPVIAVINSFAQVNHTHTILIRHDTVLLKAGECEWIIKSLPKNNPGLTMETGSTVPAYLLNAIETGKLKAADKVTNQPIPGNKIYTWARPVDTSSHYDSNGPATDTVIQRLRDPGDIPQIKIYQDWYLDLDTGKFYTEIKWIELMEGVYTSTGFFIGYTAYFRIYY